MPLPTINGTQFTSWDGRMEYPATEIGVIDAMAGIDDDALLVGSLKSRVTAIAVGVTIAGDQVTGEQFAQQLRGLVKKTVLVYDNMGVAWANVVVLSARATVTLLAIGSLVRVDCVFLFKIPVSNNTPPA